MLFRQAAAAYRQVERAEQAGAEPSSRRQRVLVIGAVAALLACHWWLGTSALREKCNTCDETIHLAAGCSYWLANDYRFQPENGNLPQRWHALPIVLSGLARLPPPKHPAWKSSDGWALGRWLFFESENDPDLLLARGRAMAALLSVGICLTIFLWSRRVFGLPGAFLSLTLAVFCPALLAHGPLMTSDACLTLFLLLSVWAIWELLHEITPLRLLGGMVAIAGLFLSKASAPLILPMALLMVGVRLWRKQPLVIRGWKQSRTLTSRPKQFAAAFTVTFACGLFAYTAVWAAYGFRHSAFADGPLTDARFYKLGDVPTACSVIPGRAGKIIAGLNRVQLLPEAYLYGSAYVLAHLRRVAFLNGEYSVSGWPHYFPYCFAVKTPLALFGVLALAAFGWRQTTQPKTANEQTAAPQSPAWYPLVPLAVLLSVCWLVAFKSTFNIGYRHILPVYPALYVLAGAAGCWLTAERRGLRVAVLGLVGLFAADSLAAYPHYLAYFNPLVRRDQAYQHLVDSNLDWGQDLPGLKRWLDAHRRKPEPVYLSYFGTSRPAHYGIEAITLPRPRDKRDPTALQPGLYCISATALQAVYEDAPGHWNKAHEARYQERRKQLENRSSSLSSAKLAAAEAGHHYGQYLRLLAHLRHRQPDDDVGYSILIFRVSAEELDWALNGPPAELEEQPWMPKRVEFL